MHRRIKNSQGQGRGQEASPFTVHRLLPYLLPSPIPRNGWPAPGRPPKPWWPPSASWSASRWSWTPSGCSGCTGGPSAGQGRSGPGTSLHSCPGDTELSSAPRSQPAHRQGMATSKSFGNAGCGNINAQQAGRGRCATQLTSPLAAGDAYLVYGMVHRRPMLLAHAMG